MLADPYSHEEQQQRCYWRRVGFGLFVVIAIALVVVPMIANAKPALVSKNAGDTVRLFNEPCAHKTILANIQPAYQSRFQSGEGEIGGKKFQMCWINTQDGMVLMLWEDGEMGKWPMVNFEKEYGA